MTKKHFIALADAIRKHKLVADEEAIERTRFGALGALPFNNRQLETLADFCATQNPNFNRERWLGYIAGTNGKNGGKL
jgi:hypothetical protein